jgi:hypothetical protein
MMKKISERYGLVIMPNIANTTNQVGLIYNKAVGPWTCERCKKVTQFAKMTAEKNVIYCTNPYCRLERIVDKRHQIIVEPDGTYWIYNPVTGQKIQTRPK